MTLERLPRPPLSELSVERLARAAQRRARSLGERVSWLTHRENLRRLETYHDRHRGERCVIVGNGPSLARTELERVGSVASFGLNRIYLAFERTRFRPTYLCCMNPTVIEQFAEELSRVRCPKFVNFSSRRRLPSERDTVHVLERFSPRFRPSPLEGLWGGGTVTFVALQLAHFMGFSRVVLVGIDHRFGARGEPNRQIVSTGADHDHFDPRYFGPGVRWDLPDLAKSEYAYRLARRAFEADGRQIVDATVDGALEVFEKVSFETEFPTVAPRP